MSEQETKPVVVEVKAEPVERTVASLTIPEFIKLMDEATVRRLQSDASREQQVTLRIFKDADALGHVATPFRIKTLEELQQFYHSMAPAFRTGTTQELVVAVAIVDGGSYKRIG